MAMRETPQMHANRFRVNDPDDDGGGDSGDRDDYDSVINPTGAGDLNITSRRNFVKISYVEGNAIGGGFLGGFMPSPISILPSSSEANAQGNDGPDFPLPTVAGNSMRVIKDGRFNANYTIEINGYGGARRLLLLLTGKSQLWFRLHCYLCSAWMEVTTDCNERVITYSANKPTMHVPLSNNNDSDEDGECSLWKGGSTEETRRREKENKRARKHPKRPKTTTMEPLEEETTTEVPMRAPIKQAFGDQLVPDGAHGR
ncbi:hypothetical protein DdX_08313 [Ditylenchus destructor]|uniref:Uncharacterized protein n=1 Tax=Ditylenchus destructor TaxID=166010 RepID=A0AAD4N8I4_9BILA|nr:hypothetical protein DdX_08313 [Ditylenchus destructor]